jgi:hypothetical protein
MTNNNRMTIDLLKEHSTLLLKSLNTLKRSVKKAESIGLKSDYSFEEMETFDSLAAKFGRTSDIFTQKVLRTVWLLLHEGFMPFIDMMNRAEKIMIIDSADKIIEIRDLRNQITHEYIPEAIQELIPEVIRLSTELEKNIEQAMSFMKKRNWI